MASILIKDLLIHSRKEKWDKYLLAMSHILTQAFGRLQVIANIYHTCCPQRI